MRICTHCKSSKDDSEFYWSKRQKNQGFNYWCRVCTQHLINARHEYKKLYLVNYLGGKCSQCGWCTNPRVLHFHHLDRTTKAFGISHRLGIKMSRLIEEAKKCVLLCHNCHVEIHLAKIPQEFMDLVNKKLAREPQRVKTAYFCMSCKTGRIRKTNQSRLCGPCYSKQRRTKIVWPTNLVELYYKAGTLTQLALDLGVARKNLTKHLKRQAAAAGISITFNIYKPSTSI